jgi:hypothetical protein
VGNHYEPKRIGLLLVPNATVLFHGASNRKANGVFFVTDNFDERPPRVKTQPRNQLADHKTIGNRRHREVARL